MALPRRTMFDEARMLARFLLGLPRFYRFQPDLSLDPDRLHRFVEQRTAHFLQVARRAIYGNASSPYRTLLVWAGVEMGDLEKLVQEEGLEGALEILHDSGVHITLDEFKCRVPIRRGSQTLEISPCAFDNPLLVHHFEAQTGGSRSAGTRLIVDLDLVAHDALYHNLNLEVFQIMDLPLVLWRPLPPGAAGTKRALMHSRSRLPFLRWYSHTEASLRNPRAFIFMTLLWSSARLMGRSIPWPSHMPLSRAEEIAEWLASVRERGPGIHFDSNVASALRVCEAAARRGLDLSHVFFRVGGEPLTPVRIRTFHSVGARVHCHYSMGEVGVMAVACGTPAHCDDVHVRLDKLAVIQRPVASVSNAFFWTTLLPHCPKIMLNVSNGDFGVIEESSCQCPVPRLAGLTLRLHSVRSFEKLSTEGMHFLGSDLLALLDESLPERFGGRPTDYQLVEREAEDGRSVLELRISPRLGRVDEAECLKTALDFLAGRASENRMMVDRLREAGSVRVVRAEPLATSVGKIIPLHVLPRNREGSAT